LDYYNSLEIHIDGASRGNPGEAGAGVLIKDPSKGKVHEVIKRLGFLTNNQAEYKALVIALEEAKKLRATHLTIYTDSALVANQIAGNWKVKDSKIKVLYAKAKALIGEFGEVKVIQIPRSQNLAADRLANRAINEYPKAVE